MFRAQRHPIPVIRGESDHRGDVGTPVAHKIDEAADALGEARDAELEVPGIVQRRIDVDDQTPDVEERCANLGDGVNQAADF